MNVNINKFLHGPNVAGQSLVDRVMAAKHSLTGEGLAKSVCKATTEEPMPPKKKHIDYLLQCTHEPNVSVPQLAGLLLERSQNEIWIVVFKSLITTHTLMNYGNERFMQYLASNNCSFHLEGFMDKGSPQGYDMSPFVRRYAKYLNAKAFSYRQMAYDFCKIKKGKDDGVLRVMEIEKLLKAVPVLQSQVDALLEFDCTRNDLNNSVINASFMMLFKDLIRLLACYNDGIINLLAKFFEMSRKQCKEGLDIYKKFVTSMESVAKFLSVAESVGIDKGDIPDLAQAPSSLMETLEAHVKTMEGSKKGGAAKGSSAALATAISDLTAAATHNGDNQNFFDESSATVTVSSNNPFADVLQPADDGGDPAADLTFDLFGGHTTSGAGGSNPFFAAAMTDADNEGTDGGGGTFVITQDDPWSSDANGQSNAGGFASDDAFAAAFGSGADRASDPSFDPGNTDDAGLALFTDNLNISASPKNHTSEHDSHSTSTAVTSGAGQDDDNDPFADLR